MEENKTLDYTDDYPRWKPEYKDTYKILVPDMLPWHFAIIDEAERQLLCNSAGKIGGPLELSGKPQI